MKTFINSLTFLLILSFSAFSQPTQTIRGKVVDALTEKPIHGVNIYLSGSTQGTTSDENGNFRIEKVPIGRKQLKASIVGYETQTLTELIVESGKELILEFRLKPSATQLDETVVKAASPNLSGALTSIQNITVEQVMRYPATYFDPARLATSFAGVANDNDQANGMVIRGNSPNGMQWRLEGVEIVNPNHLSNAGTISDQPTQNAGGVNILSAQLLGNMNFLTGAFPAEYGNATSGVMDMRLRKGNNEKHEFIAQAGIIGVDLAAEGPFSKKSKASYLVNYRYSFTGLLGLMGIKFGDENITFQDLSFNLSFPTKKAGDFTIFGMGGNSKNDFLRKEDKTLWTSEKDQFDIFYTNKMLAAGATHQVNIGKNLLWRNVLAFSGLNTLRNQNLLTTYSLDNQLQKSKNTFSSILTYQMSNWAMKGGLFLTDMNDKIVINKDSWSNKDFVVQPFINFNTIISDKLTLNAGLHYLNYTKSQQQSLEPRLSLQYRLTDKQNLSLAYGLYSQQQFIPLRNNLLKSAHYVLGHNYQINSKSYFKTELYWQQISRALVNRKDYMPFPDLTYSSINQIEGYPVWGGMVANGTGKNYGIELTYQQYLTEGFYALVNGTLYNSTYVGGDGVERNTRFNGRHIFNATLGKEFVRKKNKTWGVNGRLVWLGGFYSTPLLEAESVKQGKAVYDYTKAFTEKQKDYFRPDLRVYFKRSKARYSRTWSVDIQNVANMQNVAYKYYDTFLKKVVTKYQLGLIPIINYRWEF